MSDDTYPPFLGGQQTPRASDGIGIMLLYRCSLCRRIWFQDGHRVTLDLEEATLHMLALALHADLAHLPGATCRLCLARAGAGATDIDEYGRGTGGYGISWEFPGPPIIHALLTLLSTSWLRRHVHPAGTLPGSVTRPGQMRAVLAWFIEQQAPPSSAVQFLEPAWVARMQQANRPGFGQPGTEDWIWKGGWYSPICPPLLGEAVIQLAVASSVALPFSFAEQFALCQDLVLLTLAGSVAGEQRA